MKSSHLKSGNITTATTIAVVILILVVTGAIYSLFFSKQINDFVYHIKTDPLSVLIHAHADDFFKDGTYFKNWQSEDSQGILKDFSGELKTHIPQVVAVNIYSKDAILIWSDLPIYKETLGKKHEIDNVEEAIENKQIIKSAAPDIAGEIGFPELLEVYTTLYLGDGKEFGVVEIYLDIADLVAFIKNLYVFIWGTIFASLIIIFSLLYFAFSRQNKKIKEYSVNLEQKVQERTKELQKKFEELKKFQELTVGRELKMAELKKEIKQLKNDHV